MLPLTMWAKQAEIADETVRQTETLPLKYEILFFLV